MSERIKKISQLQDSIEILDILGTGDPEIKGIVYDSRHVDKDFAFFALKGVHVDGHDYLDEAIELGASVVVYSDEKMERKPGPYYIRVKDTRKALSPFSAAFYDYPSKEMTVIGVTGTDGKSTTVSFIQQLIEMEGEKCGYLSTVSYKAGDEEVSNPFRQSTPEAPEIQRLMRDMVDKEMEYAVIEATSHGLSPKNNRLGDVEFDAAVFTNLTHEHLEFHGTFEQYREDKCQLFRMLSDRFTDEELFFGVVNRDDPSADFFIEAAGEVPIYLYSMKNKEADLYADSFDAGVDGTTFLLHTPGEKKELTLNIPALVNVENLLAAMTVSAEVLGIDTMDLVPHVPKLKGVKGRMTRVAGKQPFDVVVDYAHSPGSFEKVLPALKALTEGKMIVVFGSAGERDVEKRSDQGEIAADYGEILILTDEDPRLEDPMAILEDIAFGVNDKVRDESLFLIPDRRKALKKALDMAEEGDLVVALGKGHESSIIYSDGPHPWNEQAVLEELLRERGY
ncbi:MAG: UDP-N-acetylmuramoyl-L-alanyl-D-glutamate--2,6-diaminopimelate ligase [Spirochaetales bacterium]|nr:UDP-N-acetylmuramoyl-L-alanyl-D-glutamate--2,6-diaminopimelate ligase [Spirochaetales bacterium]